MGETVDSREVNQADRVIFDFNFRLARALEKQRAAPENAEQDLQRAEILATLQSLPEDPVARMELFDTFKNKPDGRFSDSALSALRASVERAGEILNEQEQSWRNCLSYPDHVPPIVAKRLDEALLLIPMPEISDRYSRLMRFIDKAEEQGLLGPEIRRILAQEL